MGSISSEAEEDRISGLPDEILVNILTFLPIEEAIKTTLLRRFGTLWRSVPRLTFDAWSFKTDYEEDDHPYYYEKFANLIHHLLILYERGEIEELRVIERMGFAGVIDSLVYFAIIKGCKVLFLDFIRTGDEELQQDYILPSIVYRSVHLTQLSLDCCDITSCGEVWLKSLKLLHLIGVVMSDNAMEKILSGCPSLEELSVVECDGLHNLCFNNKMKLKKLKIRHWNNELLTVSNLNVVCLNISMDWIESVVIFKATVVDATVCCDVFEHERRSYEGFKLLLQSLDQCKTFRPNPWSVVVLAIWELTNTPCPYFKWKRLVLELHLNNYVEIGLSMLLRHVPLLETLKIHVQPKPKFKFTDEQSRWLVEYELDEDKYWNEQEASLESLKMVVIHGSCIAEPAAIRVAKFLLRNAVALEKMVISTKEFVNPNGPFYIFTCDGIEPEKDRLSTDELTCALENLVTSPKASTEAVIYFA